MGWVCLGGAGWRVWRRGSGLGKIACLKRMQKIGCWMNGLERVILEWQRISFCLCGGVDLAWRRGWFRRGWGGRNEIDQNVLSWYNSYEYGFALKKREGLFGVLYALRFSWRFENLENAVGYKTEWCRTDTRHEFENLENAVGYKTSRTLCFSTWWFENLENAVGYKTFRSSSSRRYCLRTLKML